jgi:hypothetical protein
MNSREVLGVGKLSGSTAASDHQFEGRNVLNITRTFNATDVSINHCSSPWQFSPMYFHWHDLTENIWRKNWVNCSVLTGNSAGLRTVLSSRLSHRELRSPLKKSHSFLSLPADTTMPSSQGTSVSSNSFSRWASHLNIPFQIPILTPYFTLSFLLFG